MATALGVFADREETDAGVGGGSSRGRKRVSGAVSGPETETGTAVRCDGMASEGDGLRARVLERQPQPWRAAARSWP